jgi:MFS family permease
LALVVAALLTVPVGRWLDRHPPRPLFLAGAITASAFVVVWGVSTNRPLFVASWIVLGCCQAVLFYDPAFTVLTKRYSGRARQRAITTVTLMAGLASTIFGPLTALLERTFGWRTAVVVLAAILAAVTIPCFAVGLRPPDASRDVELPDDEVAPSSLPGDVFRTRAFWLLTTAYLFSSITTYGVAVHLVAYLHDRGMQMGTAATALGAVGIVQVLGRSTFLRLSANRASIHLATWVLAAKGAGLALLISIGGLPGLALFVVVYGSANGIATLTRATTLAELYGPDYYGSISAVIAAISAIGGALAPFTVAAAIDIVGSYGPVFGALVVLSALGALANEVVARPSR